MLPLALALLAACTKEPSGDPPDGVDTVDAADTVVDTVPLDTCDGGVHTGEARVVRIGNLRDDDTPIGFLPVEGAPAERAAVVEGRLSWAVADNTDTISQGAGRRVVLFSLNGSPYEVADAALAADLTPLAVARCGDHVFLTYVSADGRLTLQRDDEVITSFAAAQTPVCSGDWVGLRVDDGEARWWWIDGEAPEGQSVVIPQDAFPVSEAPDGWLLVSPMTASRIDPATGVVAPLGLEGAFVASVSDTVAWTVVADREDGLRWITQGGQQGRPYSYRLDPGPGALAIAGPGAVAWIREGGIAAGIRGSEAFETLVQGWPMWDQVEAGSSRLMSVLALEGRFVITDLASIMDVRSGTLPLLPVEAAALRWTSFGLLDLPPGVTLDGHAPADADVPSLAVVAWRYGELVGWD